MQAKYSPTLQSALGAAILLAGAALSMPACAQTNVTVYGIIDAAVEHYSNADAAGSSMTRMPSLGGGMFPSRLGLRGSEDLGAGLKAIFALENGFAPDTGVLGQGNRLFGRQAWVGLAGNWGQLTLGRNYNMLTSSTFDIDLFGPSQYGLGSLDSFIPNGRSDNSIAYKGRFDGLSVGASYSLGRDTSSAGGPAGTSCAGESATDSKACREWSALLRYDFSGYAMVAAYDRIYGGTGAAAGLSSSAKQDSRLHVGGLAKLGQARIGGGMIARNNDGNSVTPRSRLYYLAASYQLTSAFMLDGQLGKLDYRASANGATQLLLRGIYDFSKRTAVYAAIGRIDNQGTLGVALSAGGSVGAGMGQNGIIAGVKHAF